MKFYGYAYRVGSIDTLGLMPLEDSPYAIGFYTYFDDTLVLQSKDWNEVVKPFEKMDEFGQKMLDKKTGAPLFERRLIRENLTFKLKDYTEFVKKYVDNADAALAIIEQSKSDFAKLQQNG